MYIYWVVCYHVIGPYIYKKYCHVFAHNKLLLMTVQNAKWTISFLYSLKCLQAVLQFSDQFY